jgi:hypothetical protein
MKKKVVKRIVRIIGILTVLLVVLTVVSRASAQSQPEMISPAPGSTLPGPNVSFAWSDNGISVNYWWLYVGTSQGAANLHSSGRLYTTNHTVSGLPTSDGQIYVRLWYYTGSWAYTDYQYRTGPIDDGVCPCFTIQQLNDLYDQLVANQGDSVSDCMEEDYSSTYAYPSYTYYYIEACIGPNSSCDSAMPLVAGVHASHAYINESRNTQIWIAECYINLIDYRNETTEHVLYEANLNRREVEICSNLFKGSKWVEGVTCD